MNRDPRAAYLQAGVGTAGPERLLIMLMDGLVLDVRRGLDAQQRGDQPTAHRHLVRAQEILLELRTSLKVDAFAGGPGLAALYDWLVTQLVHANIRRDTAVTADCLGLIEDLAATWRQAAVVAAGAAVPVGA